MNSSRESFVLTPVGTSGDVHPFVGIGRELRRRGHDVTVITAGSFQKTVEAAGLRFVASVSSEDFDLASNNPDLWHPRRGLKLVLQLVAQSMRSLYDRIDEVYEPGRTVLVGHALAFAARVFEEKHRVPAVTLQLAPSIFRSDFEQSALAPGRDISGAPVWLKKTLWWLVDRLMIDPNIVPELNRWRAELGLPPISRPFKAWMHSPQSVVALFPRWFGRPQPDWPPVLRMTGFPLWDEGSETRLNPELEAFLAAGDPPIVFTPGSAHRHGSAFFTAAVDAVTRLKRRAILTTRYPEQLPRTLPPHVRHVAYAPFARLLPKAAAVVHHGGIGSSAQGLAAGIPQLVMPMGFDQPDNALRLFRLGVGRWLTPKRFTGERVAAALDSLLSDPAVGAACARWAAEIAATRPIEETCDVIESMG